MKAPRGAAYMSKFSLAWRPEMPRYARKSAAALAGAGRPGGE